MGRTSKSTDAHLLEKMKNDEIKRRQKLEMERRNFDNASKLPFRIINRSWYRVYHFKPLPHGYLLNLTIVFDFPIPEFYAINKIKCAFGDMVNELQEIAEKSV